jgi:site-specific recombinase XerC
MRDPRQMEEAEINAFLSHVATEEGVSASTQNQAQVAQLLHGAGLRLMEALCLWIKDVDLWTWSGDFLRSSLTSRLGAVEPLKLRH